jgi:hypothetical protein
VESRARYTKADLIQLADEVRLGATDRLITDWIGLGLLDSPSKPGAGRGSGSKPGTWSENQKELFLTVWRKRVEGSIRNLCNIPVYLWLFWGDHHVPLRQAKRAMATWSSRQNVSADSADVAAKQLLNDFGSGPSSRAARELLAEALRGRQPAIEQVHDQLRRAIRRPATVTGAPPLEISADILVDLFTARLAAIAQITQIDDSIWEWARFTSLMATGLYVTNQPVLATDPRYGHIFAGLDHATLVLRACVNLLTMLGMALIGRGGATGSLDDPETWRTQRLRGTIIETQFGPQGLSIRYEVRQPGPGDGRRR